MRGKIMHVAEDGTATDVTEPVQVVYDLLHGSMDFGSGFLDLAEVRSMRRLAAVAGFEPIQYSLDVCQVCGHTFGKHLGAGRCLWQGGAYDYVARKYPERCDCPGFELAPDPDPKAPEEGGE